MARKKQGKTKYPIRKAPFAAILFFLILGIVGISLGEPARVLEQARQICFSCIGIG
jgi:hypothetical protein